MTSVIDTHAGAERATKLRNAMVDRLCTDGVITSFFVERAFRVVPRHRFVPEGTPLAAVYNTDDNAHDRADHPLVCSTIGPVLQARMIKQAAMRPGLTVLEIGFDGYSTALLAELVGPRGRVISVDVNRNSDAEVADHRAVLKEIGYGDRVTVVQLDAEHRVPELDEPADAILVTAGTRDIPPTWLDQLAADGTLVVPLRMNGIVRLIGFLREDDHLVSESVEVCDFAPIQGSGVCDEQTYRLHDANGHDVTVRVHGEVPPDLFLLDGVLASERTEVWSGHTINRTDSCADLYLWLASFLPGFCTIAVGEETELAAESTSWLPVGLVSGDSFAHLAAQPTADDGRIELGARAYGPHGQAAACAMVGQIRAWWDHQFGDDLAPRIAYWPTGADLPEPTERTAVLPTTHGAVTITWSKPDPPDLSEHEGCGGSDAGPAPYIRVLASLLTFFHHLPAESSLLGLAITVGPDGHAETGIVLPDAPFPVAMAALDEWVDTLVRPAALIRRAPDGDTVVIAVRGQSDYGGTPIVVWSHDISYHQLTDVDVEPGTEKELDTDHLRRWATDHQHDA